MHHRSCSTPLAAVILSLDTTHLHRCWRPRLATSALAYVSANDHCRKLVLETFMLSLTALGHACKLHEISIIPEWNSACSESAENQRRTRTHRRVQRRSAINGSYTNNAQSICYFSMFILCISWGGLLRVHRTFCA